MSRHQDVVATWAQVSCTLPPVVMMSRPQFSCRDITLCCCKLHWLFLMSRLQFFCRDIIPLISAPSSAAYTVIPVATCCSFPSIFLMSRPPNRTVHIPKLHQGISQLLSFLLCPLTALLFHLLLHFYTAFSSFFHSPC